MTPRPTLRAAFLVLAALLIAPGGCGRRNSAPAASGSTKVKFASLDVSAALSLAKKENRLVMVDFYTDWCGWCKKLDKETYSDARVAEALREVISIKVNAEKGGEAVAEQYRVRGFPTVIFLSASGEVVQKVEGFVEADEMLKIVGSLKRPA